MRGPLFVLLAVVLLLGAGAARAETLPPSATGWGADDGGKFRIEGTLLLDVREVKPGDTFRVGVRFRLDPRWHLYWRNPGESGLGTELSWDADRIDVGPLQWPFPATFRTDDGFIVTYGYADEVLLFAEARVRPDAKGTLGISAAADLLVCDINCIPAEIVVTRPLTVGAKTVPDAEAQVLFDAAAARVPRPLEEAGLNADVALAGPLRAGEDFAGTLTLSGKVGRTEVEADFFVPDVMEGIARVSIAGPSADSNEARAVFPLRGRAAPEVKLEAPRLRGVLRLGTASTGYSAYELDVPMPKFERSALAPPVAQSAGDAGGPNAQANAGTAESAEAPLALPLALLFAFLGGVILNLMPCVFPVLALKVYGFSRVVQEEGGRKAAHAIAYTLGIVGTLMLLAAAVVAVRAAGHGVGWGFQFQEPLFVAAVCAVLVVFALNLFGVFTVGGGAGGGLASRVDESHGTARSFGEGVLAVVLATPCSAPLLGTAVGFALAAGAVATFAVFIAIGLGLAAPFALLVYVPGLAKRLPKPGAWMAHVKTALGFALLGTAVWLVWVVGGLAGVDGMARLLVFLVAVGLLTWLFGLFQGAGRRGVRVGSSVVLALLAVGAGLFTLRFEGPAEGDGTTRVSQSAHGAEPWSEEAVTRALAEGRPVFVDFTADWCITCKFNERTVLATDAVRDAFAQQNVALFVADWTRRDARIGRKLAELGRAGVPVYLVYSPHRRDAPPELLPEVITPERVVEAITRAARPPNGPT